MKYQLLAVLITFGLCAHAQHSHHTFETPEGKRSDTLNVLHYDVELDVTDSITKEIYGMAELTLLSKLNGLTKVNLDLLNLSVDSLCINGVKTNNWTHSNALISVPTSPTNAGDTIRIKVAYHGLPFSSNWGGWYNNSNYQFNLGIGLNTIPHNLGKVWHPCVDNFVERATYTVSLKTFGSWVGVGSGVLSAIDTVQLSPLILNRTWELRQEIPTYLYGINVGRYVLIKDTLKGSISTVESEIYALPNQVAAMKTKTQKLEECFENFEEKFGKYHWDKVGYSTTSLGAMEHATNIAFPFSAGEDIVVHELSHHWWGNLITCETDRDMWINEGMAEFSVHLFNEDSYGEVFARREMHSVLAGVLLNAHKRDDGYHPLSGVPRVHTYGEHTYQKGGLIGNNLRVKLGDQKAFDGIKAFLDSNKFSHVNSYDLRDGLTKATGVDLTDFFNDWVFSPGMPCYVIDSFSVKPTTGLYEVNFSVRQLKANSDHFYGEIPVEVLFTDAQHNTHIVEVKVGGELTNLSAQIPINAVYISLNPQYKLNYAMTATDQKLFSPGPVSTSGLNFGSITASSVSDSIFVRAQTYWTGPNISLRNAVDVGARVNSNRYWRIGGVGEATFTMTGGYNGKKSGNDYGLIKSSEDSLVVLFREKPELPWKTIAAQITVGSKTDSLGGFRIENAKYGEYVLAEFDSSLNESLFDAVIENSLSENQKAFEAYPNPVRNRLTLNSLKSEQLSMVILNGLGVEVMSFNLLDKREIDVSSWSGGVYFILGYLQFEEKPIDYQRIVIE